MIPEWTDVKKALENSDYNWRTIRGVAKELGTTQEIVRDILAQNSTGIIKSSIPSGSGEDLFTTREHYRRKQSFLAKFGSSITSQVISSSSSGGKVTYDE